MATSRRTFCCGEFDPISPEQAEVRLILDDGSVYPFAGKLLFSDAKVEAATGQVTLRGQFPNPGRELLPGMYVRVSLQQGIDTDSIAVPQQAVQRNGAGGSEVFVVKDDGLVATQPIRTGATHKPMSGHQGSEAGRPRRDRRIPEVCRRRQGQSPAASRNGIRRWNAKNFTPRSLITMPSFFIAAARRFPADRRPGFHYCRRADAVGLVVRAHRSRG